MSRRLNNIAVASTFSPRFSAVLAEADRLTRLLDGRLSLLHASAPAADKSAKFIEALTPLGRRDAEIMWYQSATPKEAILEAVIDNEFDLLIAGAIERDSEYRNYTGGVARELLLEAPCNLALIPHPIEDAPPPQRFVVVVDPRGTFPQTILDVLKELKPKEVILLAADSPFAAAMDAARGNGEADTSAMDSFEESLRQFVGSVDSQVVSSNTGFSICEAVQGLEPDFLVVEVPFQNGLRQFPPHLDWLCQVIPSRLLVLLPS